MANDFTDTIGHMKNLSFGETELVADLNVKDPLTGEKQKIPAVIEKILWDGGYADPIEIRAWVSEKNRNSLNVFAQSSRKNKDLKFTFKVEEREKSTLKYFPSFHSNDVSINGLLRETNGKKDLVIKTKPHPDVRSVKIFQITFTCLPVDGVQSLFIQIDPTRKFTKPWGITKQ
jgi:hypothetical protein